MTPGPIAPLWHTSALILLIVLVAAAGTLLTQRDHVSAAPAEGSRLAGYLPMMVVPWLLIFYVARVGRDRPAQRSLSMLLGRTWDSLGRAAVDLGLAIALAVFIRIFEGAFAAVVDPQRVAVIAAMLPHSLAERAAWILVAVSVGIGEEVVYRGYLQTQLGALTRRPWVGLVLQALLFGLAHLEQGPASALRIVFYGLLFGVLVRFRRSLLPAIVAHVALDLSSMIR